MRRRSRRCVELWAYSSNVEWVIFWLCGSSWNLQAVTATDDRYALRSAPDFRYALASAVVRGTSKARIASSSSCRNADGVRPVASHPAHSRSVTDVTRVVDRAASFTKVANSYRTRA